MDNKYNRIESPCIRNCCLNEEDVCLGCFRSVGEITQWGEADNAQRRRILINAEQRKIAHDAKWPKY